MRLVCDTAAVRSGKSEARGEIGGERVVGITLQHEAEQSPGA